VVLRRALAYIDDHADQPITVAQIAAAAHVTPRALQYAFRRHLDTTPLAEASTVTGIAARWGFYHPGRFASLYRDMYRRAPHQTLNGG
jgi:transcriptional regulator GlxA family with amidase domain